MEATYGGIALTGLTPSEFTGPVAISRDRAVQITPLVDSPRAYIKARGNRSVRVRFAVVRMYENIVAAIHARGSFPESLPDAGVLELTHYSPTLGQTVLQTGNAVLGPMKEPVMNGRAIEWEFEFLCAQLSSQIAQGAYMRNPETGELLLNPETSEPIYQAI